MYVYKPDFIVAKGGMTSLHIAKEAFSWNACTCLGQMEEGVSVWMDDKKYVNGYLCM
jgi:hypothetical protein